MTYVRIVPSFITHSQLLATTLSLWAERSLLMLPGSGQWRENVYIYLTSGFVVFNIASSAISDLRIYLIVYFPVPVARCGF